MTQTPRSLVIAGFVLLSIAFAGSLYADDSIQPLQDPSQASPTPTTQVGSGAVTGAVTRTTSGDPTAAFLAGQDPADLPLPPIVHLDPHIVSVDYQPTDDGFGYIDDNNNGVPDSEEQGAQTDQSDKTIDFNNLTPESRQALSQAIRAGVMNVLGDTDEDGIFGTGPLPDGLDFDTDGDGVPDATIVLDQLIGLNFSDGHVVYVDFNGDGSPDAVYYTDMDGNVIYAELYDWETNPAGFDCPPGYIQNSEGGCIPAV